MRRPREPLSLAMIRKEIDELLFLVERLDGRTIAGEEDMRDELTRKLAQARGQLTEIIIQRTP